MSACCTVGPVTFTYLLTYLLNCPTAGAMNGHIMRSVPLANKKGPVWRIPAPLTLTIDLELPKFNHLVPCGQGYDWQSSVTIGLKLAPESCSQTYTYILTPAKT